MIEVYALTDKGMVRANNQDKFAISKVSDTCAWSIVCDGMGGVNGGSIASEIASDTIMQILKNDFSEDLLPDDIVDILTRAIYEANEKVYDKSLQEPDLKGMGTTVVISVVTGFKLYTAHVGDSRVYIKTIDGIEQVTKDHSYVQNLVDSGEITAQEALTHPHKNIITRSVGGRKSAECDINVFNIYPGDVVISCSDGLSNYLVDDEEFLKFIEDTEPENLAGELVNFANNCGGQDNVTVSTIHLM